jgi:hypothetical protein
VLTTIQKETSPRIQHICDVIPRDTFSCDIQEQLNSHGSIDSNDHLNTFQFKEGLLYFKGLLYVPTGFLHLQIIQAQYDLLFAGHF